MIIYSKTKIYIGKIFEILKNYYESFRKFEEALQIDQQINDLMGIASDLYNIGRIWTIRGEYRKALQNFKDSLKILNQLNQEQYIEVIQKKINELREKINI
ncbi:MAG: tetratricopeptide repeat protein [Promethearchaeota archaeon]